MSEQQCAAVMETVQRGGKRLHRWVHKMEKMYPAINHDIPPASAMNIGKLGYGGVVTSDTCNSVRKTRRLLVDQIINAALVLSDNTDNINVLEIDCWNHLRNVWNGGMMKAVSTFLKDKLQDELETIDSRLRVTPNIDMILRTVDK